MDLKNMRGENEENEHAMSGYRCYKGSRPLKQESKHQRGDRD